MKTFRAWSQLTWHEQQEIAAEFPNIKDHSIYHWRRCGRFGWEKTKYT